MPRHPRCATLCMLATLLALLASSATVNAQAATGALDLARATGREGLSLFEREQWSDAFERFQRADTLHHAPTLVLHMARCKVRLGELDEARRIYREVVGEALSKDASEIFKRAQEAARVELAALETIPPPTVLPPAPRKTSPPVAAPPLPPVGVRTFHPAIVGAGVGLVVVATGAGLTCTALSNEAASDLDAVVASGDRGAATREAFNDANERRVVFGNMATASFLGATAIAVATGTYVAVTVWRSKDGSVARVQVPVGPASASLALSGRW